MFAYRMKEARLDFSKLEGWFWRRLCVRRVLCQMNVLPELYGTLMQSALIPIPYVYWLFKGFYLLGDGGECGDWDCQVCGGLR